MKISIAQGDFWVLTCKGDSPRQLAKNDANRSEMLGCQGGQNPQAVEEAADNLLKGKTVVATGSLRHFARDGISQKLVELGAKPSGSVSKRTQCNCWSRRRLKTHQGTVIRHFDSY